MPRPVQDLEYEFDVQFVEISEDVDLDRRAGISLLLQWIRAARNIVGPTDRPAPDHAAVEDPTAAPAPLLAGSLME
jgi:hypothetical protein